MFSCRGPALLFIICHVVAVDCKPGRAARYSAARDSSAAARSERRRSYQHRCGASGGICKLPAGAGHFAGITPAEGTIVAKLCCGNPALLRLMAGALSSNRITMKVQKAGYVSFNDQENRKLATTYDAEHNHTRQAHPTSVHVLHAVTIAQRPALHIQPNQSHGRASRVQLYMLVTARCKPICLEYIFVPPPVIKLLCKFSNTPPPSCWSTCGACVLE